MRSELQIEKRQALWQLARASMTAALALSGCVNAHAVDLYDPGTKTLTIDAIAVGGMTYRSVALTINAFTLLGTDSNTPGPTSFDPATNQLSLGAVAVGSTIYNNVRVTVSSYTLLGVGGGVPTPTYPSGSDELNAFNFLNGQRLRCGFGMLKQSKLLDQVSINHVNYRFLAPAPGDPRLEVAGNAGFTGATPNARAAALGYQTDVNVLDAFAVYSGPNAGAGAIASAAFNRTREMLSNPYSGLMAISASVDLGIGKYAAVLTSGLYASADAVDLSFGFGMTPSAPVGATNASIRTYPCEGSTNVNPFGSIFSYGGPPYVVTASLLGPPVMVVGEPGKTLEIVGATMTPVGASITVYAAAAFNTQANDPNPSLIPNVWSGYAVMRTPLGSNRSYLATVNYRSGGVPGTTTFTFTTGSQ